MLTNQLPDKGKMAGKTTLLLFDLAIGGHHGNYIRHLVNFWYQQQLPVQLKIVVLPEFLKIHSDVVNLLAGFSNPTIDLITITPQESAILDSRQSSFGRQVRNFREWYLLCKYASANQATHCLIMYFDTCELPLTFGIKAPCSFSGIYFRPTFHYPHFAHYVPSRKDRLQHWREKFTLNRILRHPQLHTLFSLDPFAVKYLQRFHSKVNLLHLPDPIEIHPVESEAVNHLREQLAIEAGRKVFLLFGALDGRKGIYQLLAALSQVPLEVSQQICLILAGAPSAAERIVLQQQVDAVRQSHQVQIIERYEFLPEADIPVYFQLADVVLALYQRHVGMSGILLWAAAAQKPILSSNYGLMGEMVRAYQLGLAIDSTQPEAIAQGLTQLLSQPLEQVGDRAAMQRFAEQNAAENFAQIIFSQILKPSL